MRFKTFLLTEGGLETVSWEDAKQIYKGHCSDTKEALYRRLTTDDRTLANHAVVGGEQQRQRFSLGGSGTFQKLITELQAWKDVPNRFNSIFCSTTDYIEIGDDSDPMTRIFPFNGVKLATISGDFNTHNFKVNGGWTDVRDISSALYMLGTMVDNDHSSPLEMLKDFWRTKPANARDVQDRIGRTFNYELAEAIMSVGFLKYLTPENVGVDLHTTKTLKDSDTTKEVWLDGKYLSIPEKNYDEFMEEVK